MFYNGVIATKGENVLCTYQNGEVSFEDKNFVGVDTPKLAQEDVHDSDLDAEVIVEIYVDKYFTIIKAGQEVPDEVSNNRIFFNYDEAMSKLDELS